MPHVDGKIRVKRKGSGPRAVTTDNSDVTIGEKPRTLEWIKRPSGDGDPGDDFKFSRPNPLEDLPANLFKILSIEDHRVTVAYKGTGVKTEWSYWIHVTDVRATGDDEPVTTSDGSATIKNK
jgi:hypothetical protein